MAKASMKKMLEAGVHFGHRSRFWHPKMKPFIYGTRNNVHIINLEKTLTQFNEALNFISKTIANGESILFVGTKRSASETIKEEAIRCGMPYVNHRWLGGMITNYKTIKNSIKRLKDLEFLAEENFFQFSKKEALMMTREMKKLERSLGGIKNINGIPDVVFIVDIGYEKNAAREARALNLPIIGIVDTNHNPEGIDYVIAGNDDSIRAIGYYTREIANTILEAKASIATNNIETKATVKYFADTEQTQTQKNKNNNTKTNEKKVEKVATKDTKTQKNKVIEIDKKEVKDLDINKTENKKAKTTTKKHAQEKTTK